MNGKRKIEIYGTARDILRKINGYFKDHLDWYLEKESVEFIIDAWSDDFCDDRFHYHLYADDDSIWIGNDVEPLKEFFVTFLSRYRDTTNLTVASVWKEFERPAIQNKLIEVVKDMIKEDYRQNMNALDALKRK